MERYADYKTHCLHEIGWANAGVTTPIPLWVRNTGQPVDVPWFRWELSNRVHSSCPVRRIPRQDPLHTTGWESLTNGWYTIIPKDKVKAELLLITEHSSHTPMCMHPKYVCRICNYLFCIHAKFEGTTVSQFTMMQNLIIKRTYLVNDVWWWFCIMGIWYVVLHPTHTTLLVSQVITMDIFSQV